jgi:hypothetical protein
MQQKRGGQFTAPFAMVVYMTTASKKSCGDTSAAIATWSVESSRAFRSGILQSQNPTCLMNTPSNFKTAYCARFEYPHDNFEKRVFWSAMHPEIKPVALLINCVWPGFFRSDLDCIRSVATAETKQEVRAIVNSLQYDPAFKRGFFRGFLRVRISGRRLTRLAARVLAGER